MTTRTALFICVENACRSLMAEAIFNADPPPGWVAISAGTRPAREVNPRTGPMLRELGLNLPPHPPQQLTAEMIDHARVRVTMGCLDDASCPARLKTMELRDWSLPDPATLNDEGFRQVRDRIQQLVRSFRAELVLSDGRQNGVAEVVAAGSVE
ncbi:MAG: low molecular weight phosphatase family protein [Thermoplasmatales archaeon]|nr:low molecular weight phosphatase family protein [Thermoplasmatales archaeon]